MVVAKANMLAQLGAARDAHEAERVERMRVQKLNQDLRHQVGEIEDLRREKADMKRKVSRLRSERNKFKVENENLTLAKQASQGEMEALRERADTFENKLRESEERVADLTRQLGAMNVNEERAQAVREFRASKVHKADLENYSAAFIKYGFYMARTWLESQRPGEEFKELVFTPQAGSTRVPDWRIYGDPDTREPWESLNFVPSELDRPSGPWTPLHASSSAAPEAASEPEPYPQQTPEVANDEENADYGSDQNNPNLAASVEELLGVNDEHVVVDED